MKPTTSGHTAVMARRVEPPDSLDYFPTPPWATRALCEVVLRPTIKHRTVWEPAAGEGHMAEVLREYFEAVYASDVHDYGRGYAVGSFVGSGPDVLFPDVVASWVITNPPFVLACEFAKRALGEAAEGVALLVRTAWLESAERWRTLFHPDPPSEVALFVERVPMVKGRWDPEASTATSYAWVIWDKSASWFGCETRLTWIPPGQRKALERPNDRERFAA